MFMHYILPESLPSMLSSLRKIEQDISNVLDEISALEALKCPEYFSRLSTKIYQYMRTSAVADLKTLEKESVNRFWDKTTFKMLQRTLIRASPTIQDILFVVDTLRKLKENIEKTKVEIESML